MWKPRVDPVEEDLGRMNLSETSKWNIFIVLMIAIGVSLIYSSGYQNGDSAAVRAKRKSARTAEKAEELPLVNLLHYHPPFFGDVKRNVFQFRAEEAPQLSEGSKPATPSMTQVFGTTTTLPDVRYLGLYREKENSKVQIAAISNGGQIYVGGVGDTLAGKYEVLGIEDEFLILKILATNKIMRFRLGKTNSLPTIEPDSE
jgi:hypothetical protein